MYIQKRQQKDKKQNKTKQKKSQTTLSMKEWRELFSQIIGERERAKQLARFLWALHIYRNVLPSKYALGSRPYRNVLRNSNPVTFPNTPQHARAHYCSTERHARSFSKKLLALVAADTQGHAASSTNQVLASTLHQPFGFVSTPSFTLLGSLPLANNGHHSATILSP